MMFPMTYLQCKLLCMFADDCVFGNNNKDQSEWTINQSTQGFMAINNPRSWDLDWLGWLMADHKSLPTTVYLL